MEAQKTSLARTIWRPILYTTQALAWGINAWMWERNAPGVMLTTIYFWIALASGICAALLWWTWGQGK